MIIEDADLSFLEPRKAINGRSCFVWRGWEGEL